MLSTVGGFSSMGAIFPIRREFKSIQFLLIRAADRMCNNETVEKKATTKQAKPTSYLQPIPRTQKVHKVHHTPDLHKRPTYIHPVTKTTLQTTPHRSRPANAQIHKTGKRSQ
jgi:hypothetical protein